MTTVHCDEKAKEGLIEVISEAGFTIKEVRKVCCCEIEYEKECEK